MAASIYRTRWSGAWDFYDPCVRALWASLLPVAFIFTLAVARPLLTNPTIASFFHNILPLDEAESLLNEQSAPFTIPKPPAWKSRVLSWLALMECAAWIAFGSYRLRIGRNIGAWEVWIAFSIASTWLYAALRPLFRSRTASPPYDLFVLYMIHLTTATMELGAVMYNRYTLDVPFPQRSVLTAMAVHFIVLMVLIGIVMHAPMAIPSSRIDKAKIGTEVSPEDYATLWSWTTFSWVEPLIARGVKTTLNEDDVWELSPTLRSKLVFAKFSGSRFRSARLIRWIFFTNSLDLTLDFILTLVSATLNYASPFFLKSILDAIADPTPENRAYAYIYATLSFVANLLKAQADAQHLWYGRHACSRVRSGLMAAIYDKALKRKDFSGAGVWQDKLKQANSELDGHVKKDVDDNTTPSKSADTGKIVQLMSGDADRIVFLISGAYIIYGAPLEIIIASAFLYQLLGLSAFAGISVLIIITPLNRYFSRRTITIAEELLAARDKRMGLLNELIGAVKFIKFFAWEEKWIKRVQGLRETELKWVLKDRINDVMFSFLWACAPVMVSIIGLLTYTLSGNVLTVSKAFTAVALFSMLRIPLNNLPHWIVRVLEAGVSVTRISDFLGEDEVSDHVSTLNKASTNPGISPEDELIGIDNGSFKWNEPKRAQLNADRTQPAELTNGEPLVEPPAERESSRFELQSISVTFPSRELSVITGPTGSGKTALLLALLGEMTPSTDSTVVHLPKNTTQVDDHGLMNSVSYCAQTTWLEHQSIKENILFRSPYDKARYQQVLECCALNPDLAVFEDGDDTEIGARGVSLSGGQKARVALARAVYARTKHVLLDDVFAAVDSHTARFIFDHLFQGPLMANRTIILVTHHVNLVLPRIHYLIRMGPGGTVDRQGTIQDLRAQGVLEAVVRDFTSDTYASETIVEPQGVVDTSEIEGLTGANAIPKPDTVKPDIKRTKLIQAEVRATGNVKWSIYKTYLEASSWWTWTTFIPILIAIQGCNVAERIWLGVWGDAYDEASSIIAAVTTTARQSPDLTENAYFPSYDVASKMPMPMITNPSSLPSANAHPMFYIGVFSAIVLGAVLLNTTSSLIQSFGSYRASRRLFSRVLATVVQAPMRWFDTTPTGRILNRFSRDIETIDSSLGSSINSTTHYLATFAAGVLTVAVFLPQFLAPALLIGYLYYTLSIGYIRTGRDLRRMESNTHSPIFSAFGELLNGIVTIRAFSAERVFFDEMHSKIDLTTKMWYSLWMLNRYLSLHFDMIGALSVFLTTLFALLSSASPELVGVTITSAMAFTDSVYWACRQTTQLEMDLNSVERVVEYLDIPQEPPNIVESHRPPAYWPSSASLNPLVQVEDLEIRYAPELDPVLKGVSFTLKARERIGLLGRTGSGKSTLAMALLRFVEPSKGRITIDGVDVTTIGLQDLRSRLTIIPQDAVLFSGTIRDNLDPFQEHDDGTLRDALLRVQLVSDNTHQSGDRSSQASSARDNTDDRGISQGFGTVMGSEEQTTLITLNTRVSASGANFSHGQRQLVALARALLRQSTVIIMDEATSSIDFNTDATIQKTIREQFGNSLLITIAHRIRTVVDYDRLIIMDKGTIVEFDTPSNLIAKEGGLFREMCMKSGAFGELAEAIASASVGSPTALHK